MLSPSYKRTTSQSFVKQNQFCIVSFTSRVDWPMIQSKGKTIICVSTLVCYGILIFNKIMNILKLQYFACSYLVLNI